MAWAVALVVVRRPNRPQKMAERGGEVNASGALSGRRKDGAQARSLRWRKVC